MLYSMERPFYNAAFNKINIGKIMSLRFRMSVLCTALALAVAASPAVAANKKTSAETPAEQLAASAASSAGGAQNAKDAFIEEMLQRARPGPAVIDLGVQGKLKLPEGMLFVGKADANKLMEMWGNSPNPDRYGLVFPAQEEVGWWVDLNYVDSGYIKDDDAKDWDTANMLETLKEGNEEQNKVRKANGIAEIETHGWIEQPHYDAATHRLIWSVDVHEKGKANDNPAVNYNTYALGRKGYINLTLITESKEIAKYKPVAQQLLADIEFNQGERYADYNAATDKVAEYGLAALVGGVAAKKLGLLAVIGAFLAKAGKFLIIGAVAVGGAIKSWLGRRRG